MPQLNFQPNSGLYVHATHTHIAVARPWFIHSLAWSRTFGIGAVVGAMTIASTFAAQLPVPNQLAPAQAPPVTQGIAKSAPTPKPSPKATAQATEPDATALQAVLNKWQSDNASGQFGVVVQELGGQKRSASLQADASFPAASLYKLFLAQFLYNKISRGQLSMTDTLGMSTDIGTCLQRIIIFSDNTCGEGLAGAIGWGNLNAAVLTNGFSESSTDPSLTTSAHDMASYLEQLQNGSLLNQTDTQSLLGYMEQQIYRSGIPAGVPGLKVADKVGVTDNIWDDVAIVNHPKGAYILVVLSTNSGPAAIRDLSQRISDFMNQ